MAKHLKLTIKNTQIAEAINLGGLKKKLAKAKEGEEPAVQKPSSTPAEKAHAEKSPKEEHEAIAKVTPEEVAPRIRARSKSVFSETPPGKAPPSAKTAEEIAEAEVEPVPPVRHEASQPAQKTSEELRRELFGDISEEPPQPTVSAKSLFADKEEDVEAPVSPPQPIPVAVAPPEKVVAPKVQEKPPVEVKKAAPSTLPPPERVKLGPTGRHISDLLPPKRPPVAQEAAKRPAGGPGAPRSDAKTAVADTSEAGKAKARKGVTEAEALDLSRKGKAPTKEFKRC